MSPLGQRAGRGEAIGARANHHHIGVVQTGGQPTSGPAKG
jgi:hypothetical protein